MKIGILGGGNMGLAISKLVNRNLKNGSITISNKSNVMTIENSDILFLCSKPNDIKNILNDFNNSKHANRLIVSCAAGVSLKYIEQGLDSNYPIIRCMPNLPISLQKGTITYSTNSLVTENILEDFQKIIKGPDIHKIDNESILDLTTILVGCMPAYISYFAKENIKFGCLNGLTYEQSRDLYISTVNGTMEMLKKQTPDEIIKSVSSPNGVTSKGISYLKTTLINSIIFNTLYKSFKSIASLKH